MKYLVDANVLSEPTKPSPRVEVVEWLKKHERDLVVDSIVLGELLAGVLALPSGRKRRRLDSWFETVEGTIECLSWDAAVSRRWARLVVDLRRRGRMMPLLDSMIASTALEHSLTVATRNVADFRKAGVAVVNPFE